MARKILLGALILLIAAALIFYFYFGMILKRGIEYAGTRSLGTQVSVSGAGVSPLSGNANISELLIANPDGFDAPYVFELGELDITMRFGSIFSDVIEIDSIVIDQPRITYENRISTDNIRALLANLPTGGDAPQGEEVQAGAGKRVIIRDFRMHSPRVTLAAGTLSAPVEMSDIHLQNIGDEANPATVPDAAREILLAVSRNLLATDLRRLGETIEEAVEGRVEEVEDLVRGLRDRLPN